MRSDLVGESHFKIALMQVLTPENATDRVMRQSRVAARVSDPEACTFSSRSQYAQVMLGSQGWGT